MLLFIIATVLSTNCVVAREAGNDYQCAVCLQTVDKILNNDEYSGMTIGEACSHLFSFESSYCDNLPNHYLRVNQAVSDNRKFCALNGFCPQKSEKWKVRDSTSSGSFDVRVSKALGSRGYDKIRLSIISNYSIVADTFTYSQPFQYRWTSNDLIGPLYLNTGVVTVTPGEITSFTIEDQQIDIYVPPEDSGVRGIIIADPCFTSEWVNCQFSEEFQTFDRLTSLLNVAMQHNDTDFFEILGDNFYDQDGNPTASWFAQLNQTTKYKILATVPGNHDFWVAGSPQAWTSNDQLANGFMQNYGQDVFASKSNSYIPYDFSVNPNNFNDSEHFTSLSLPPPSNFFFYNKIGNIAMIGFSGAHLLTSMTSMFEEACEWANTAKPSVILLLGHWNAPGDGCLSSSTPSVWGKIRVLPACAPIAHKFRFFMGHTHCNRVPLNDTGFLVGGTGMSNDGYCINEWGLTTVDSTDGTFKVYHFPIQTEGGADNYQALMDCFQSNGISGCYNLAELWSSVEI